MRTISVNDSLQRYVYECSEPIGSNFDSKFKPQLTPREMLELGVFGGDVFCRRRQRQALLHWAYDSRKL